MRLTHGLRVLGVVLLALLFGGAQAAAQGTGGHALALQDDEVCTELVMGMGTPAVLGTPVDTETEFTDATPDAATPDDDDDTDENDEPFTEDTDIGTPDDVAVEAHTGATPEDDISAALSDSVLDSEDEGFLCQDVDGDGTFEIGIDRDASGTLDEDEVLGTDVNNDEALALDELDPEVAVPENTPEG